MADQKQSQGQSQDFLGGGPKFNSVGRDNRSAPGMEEPIIPINRTGYWLRVGAVILVIAALGGMLFYLNENNIGKTKEPFTRGGRAVSPDVKTDVPADPNFK